MRVHNDIMISLDSGNSVILVLLDLSVAFDHDLYFCLGLKSVLELPVLLLPGSSPIFVVVHNLSVSIIII